VNVSPMLMVPWFVQADDVARPGLVEVLAVGGEEGERIGDAHFLAEAHVEETHALLVAAEQMRMNAMRSRCPGSMFAWILTRSR